MIRETKSVNYFNFSIECWMNRTISINTINRRSNSSRKYFWSQDIEYKKTTFSCYSRKGKRASRKSFLQCYSWTSLWKSVCRQMGQWPRQRVARFEVEAEVKLTGNKFWSSSALAAEIKLGDERIGARTDGGLQIFLPSDGKSVQWNRSYYEIVVEVQQSYH